MSWPKKTSCTAGNSTGMFPKDTLLYAPATANLIRAFGGRMV